MGAPIRLRGIMRPQGAVPSPFASDPGSQLILLQRILDLYPKLEESLKRVEAAAATIGKVKQGKQGTPGISVDHARVVSDVLARMPQPQELDDARMGRIADMVVQRMPQPKRGKPGRDAQAPVLPDKQEMVDHLFEQFKNGKKKITAADIAGFEETIASIRRAAAGFNGGGDTVEAGSGIVITDTVNGRRKISSTGIATFYSETPTGLIDGINTVYTTTRTITTVLGFWINGEYIHPSDYSTSGNTITFNTPLDASLSGLPFTIVYA